MAIQDSFNQLVGTVAGAAVSTKHLANQEKTNEINYVKTKGDLELGISDAERNIENIKNVEIPVNDYEQKLQGIESNKLHDLNEVWYEAAKAGDPKALDELKAISKAQDELNIKKEATTLNRANMENNYARAKQNSELLHNQLDLLNKQNPKLAKKYGGAK